MDCIFCKIVAGEIPSKQIYSDDHAVAFLDIDPWHAGHSVVIPRRHVADLTEDETALAEIAPAITASSRLLTSALGAAGLNVLSNVGEVAGQSVFHLHVHLIPRYSDNPGMGNIMNRQTDIDIDDVYARILAVR